MSLVPNWVLIGIGVLVLTGSITGAVYLYFNDKQYNYLTRASAWLSRKLGASEEDRDYDKEEVMEEVEKTVEEEDIKAKDPKQLFQLFESWAENKEHIGRMEERRKKREDENLKDILTINVVMTGALLLLKLWNMFGGSGAA